MRIGRAGIYKVVAQSLAVGTKDHSAKRILEATQCVVRTLRDQGYYVEPIHKNSCARAVQKLIDKYVT